MRTVIRDGGSNAGRRSERKRITALVATFLLLLAGVVVSAPGLITASASGSANASNGQGGGNECDNENENENEGEDENEIEDEGNDDSSHSSDESETFEAETGGQGDVVENEDENEGANEDETSTTVDGDACGGATTTTIEVHKVIEGEHGGTLLPEDFLLFLDGQPIEQFIDTPVTPGMYTVTEEDQFGYQQRAILCNDLDTNDQISVDGVVMIEDGQRVSCAVINDEIAPTVSVDKEVHNDNGGSNEPEDFGLSINEDTNVAHGVKFDVMANETTVVSEDGEIAGYAPVSIACTSDLADSENTKTAWGTATIDLLPVLGENIECLITNDDVAPGLTIVKSLPQANGGDEVVSDFALQVNGDPVLSDEPGDFEAGVDLVISETQLPGYVASNITCISTDPESLNNIDSDNPDPAALATVVLGSGEGVVCTITNDDVAPTVTIDKVVVGGDKTADAFQMLLGGLPVDQGIANDVHSNTPIEVSEDEDPDYTLAGIECTDDDNEGAAVANPLVLDEGQNVTCVVTNMLKTENTATTDLVVTKSDDGIVKVAGGASFTYTITVDNRGPDDVPLLDDVTVTDQLPDGLVFVLPLPVNCSQAGQTLACDVDPADLQVEDDPVVIMVTVRALPSAASGTYTNVAFADTPSDPACTLEHCVPVCGLSNSVNNVACEDTDIRREAAIIVDKVDNVEVTSPGGTYSYFMKVTNPGPSTFLANLTLTDDLPDDLQLQDVIPGASWTCNDADPLVCHYGADLQPEQTTSVVQIVVSLDPNFLGNEIVNEASAFAIVDSSGSAPGIVVTAIDAETTSVVRTADLKIVKTVSQSTAKVGDSFNWVIDVVNNGPNPATNLVISDTLPPQFEVIAAFPTAGLTCTNTTSSVQCTATSLFVGSSLRVLIQVRVVPGAAVGTITNTASVSASSTDPNPADNKDSESIDLQAVASSGPTPSPGPGSAAPAAQLPRTGNSPLGGPLTLATLLIGGGVLSLVIARRRRTTA